MIIPLVFSSKFFVQLTPIYAVGDFRNPRSEGFTQEVFASYALKEKLQLTGFFRRSFEDEISTFQLGVTLFF